MTDIDKFYSDADRLVSRASAPGSPAAGKLGAELSRLFLIWTRDFGDLGTKVDAYWTERYAHSLKDDTTRQAAVAWLGAAVSLLNGCFTADMDFPEDDWAEIREIISAEAENMDMDLLTSILTVIVDRGKA